VPELAELRHTADYVNHVVRHTQRFKSIRKNPAHKGQDMMPMSNDFTIVAQTRGKELMLTLNHQDGRSQKMIMIMGMSGFFEARLTPHKHGHLVFVGKEPDPRVNKECLLSFVDVRRFGKWKWASGWSKNRGPDPTQEYDKFVANVRKAAKGTKGKNPIHLAMLDQSIFNGTGNYMRAEILGRMPSLNPFSDLKSTIEHPNFFPLCRDVAQQAYYDKSKLIKFYTNTTYCYGLVDKKKRRFWYPKKWEYAAVKHYGKFQG